jgi:hypothetical protein
LKQTYVYSYESRGGGSYSSRIKADSFEEALSILKQRNKGEVLEGVSQTQIKEPRPSELFKRGEYLEAAHGLCYLLSRSGTEKSVLDSVQDWGALHETIHLAIGIDIDTHSTLDEIFDEYVKIEESIPGYL